MATSAQDLAASLRHLMEMPVSSKADLDGWYREAHAVQEQLKGFAMEDRIPQESWHRLWHYLSDADTRLKSSDYAKMQNDFLSNLVSQLERGL